MAENIESSTTSAEPTPPAPTPARHFGVGSLIIVPSLFAALIVGQQGSKTTAPPAAAAAPTPAVPAAAPGAPTEPAPAVAAIAAMAPEAKSLKSELEELSAQLKKVHGQVDRLPQPAPVPDLKPLEGKIDELSKSITVARSLLEKVDKLGGSVGDVGKQIESLQSDVVALTQRKTEK